MSISLKTLLENVPGVMVSSYTNVELSEMTIDSREVKQGYVFVALKGTSEHGIKYAAIAEQLGAVAILWDYDQTIDPPPLDIPLIAIKELPASLGGIAARLYDYSDQPLQIVGITGTDGKTSVSHFLAQAMNASGESCSVIGTLGIGNPSALEKATHTTPDVISVHKNLQRLSTRGSRCVAMEVSSHALDQQRVAGVVFDVAVLSNLTRDHLDYHGTVEAYADAKARLFTQHQPKTVVLNLNDKFGVRLAKKLKQTETAVYGYSSCEEHDSIDLVPNALVASSAKFDHQGLSADIAYRGESYRLNASVLGDFNLSNLLAAAGALIALGNSPEEAIAMVSKVSTVPGRIEKVEYSASVGFSQNFLVAVDYAHTPAALESVLKALRSHCTGKLICVFGCGGNRDKGKRTLMAAVAERLADSVIVTDDNPRYENPKQIMQEILAGFEQPESVDVEHDRAIAINKAIASAEAGDVVLVAGKGHEKSQLVEDRELPFDDREQITRALAKLAERAVA